MIEKRVCIHIREEGGREKFQNLIAVFRSEEERRAHINIIME
jgi:hypothetical protein